MVLFSLRRPAFQIFVNAFPVPVDASFYHLGGVACNDYVRFVETSGHDTSPPYDAVVCYPYVFAHFDITSDPDVPPDFDALCKVQHISSFPAARQSTVLSGKIKISLLFLPSICSINDWLCCLYFYGDAPSYAVSIPSVSFPPVRHSPRRCLPHSSWHRPECPLSH